MAANTFAKMIKDKVIEVSKLGLLINLDDVHVRPGFNRRMDTEALREENEKLFVFMMGGGTVPPLEVVPRAEGGVWIVEGHRRQFSYHRCREAGRPIEKILITQFVGNDADQVARIATSNNQVRLADLELSFIVKDLQVLNLSESDIAKKLNIQLAKVKLLLELAVANTDVHELLKTENISTSLVVERVQEHGAAAAEKLKEDVEKTKKAGKKKVTKKSSGGKETPAKFGAAQAKKFAFILSSAEIIEEEDRDIIVIPKGAKVDVMSIQEEVRQFLKEKGQEGDKKNQIDIPGTKKPAAKKTPAKQKADKKTGAKPESDTGDESESVAITKENSTFEQWGNALFSHAKTGGVEISSINDWKEDFEAGLSPEEALA
ncbi:chromosome partitioning protein ParB [Serratia sp. MF2]|uniref:chromosome partitioning protein ParB n=1 Tax=Serratia sp. MF2 TaxID=3059173 RepID=UPI0027F8EC12|nr:chromosome partitioning protein ParB [Serratia sp. MF2]MDQ7101913.1 chromosome partitioning protein ParB [Serratia sp. MF2]